MTKADLITDVMRALQMSREESEAVVASIFETMITALHSGDTIEIRGFGSFRTRQRQARKARHPKTGVPIAIAAKRIPYFTPSKALRAAVNNSAPPIQASVPASPPTLPSQNGRIPRADRVPFRYQIQLILENGRRQSVRTVNISQSGMLVVSLLPIKNGARVRISTQELPFLCISASIRRCVRRWLMYRISLQFDSLLSTVF